MVKKYSMLLLAAAAGLLLAFRPGGAAGPTGWTVVAWNNLGMHCMDADFGVFAILPPYNTIQAQVVNAAGARVADPTQVSLTYEAVADAAGSINRTSAGKTNFWANVQSLFKASLPADTGLLGLKMPGSANVPQPMGWDATRQWWIAEGIPLTPYDDAGVKNTYPLMKVTAKSPAGAVLASTNIVLPVSDEMDCSSCHSSTSGLAARPYQGWVYDANPQRDYRRNILRLHDDMNLSDPAYVAALAANGYSATGLEATAAGGHAILCASCHLSEALAGSGRAGIEPLTQAVHSRHSSVIDPTTGLALDSTANRSSCYRCHPGAVTKCLRGAMGSAVAADGSMLMQCQSCHGSMSAVGAAARTGWLQEPSCQQCHTGTATQNSGQIRYTSVFDASGAPRVPASTVFSTTADVPAAGFSLYRFSTGHGGLQCAACHGSTHAEFPSSEANDNLQSIALQGHAGPIAECAACHGATTPSPWNGGPHGMHPVGSGWVSQHQDVAGSNRAACQACHGTDYRGTVLSATFTNRSFSTERGTVTLAAGTLVGCYTCHNGPSGDGAPPTPTPSGTPAATPTPTPRSTATPPGPTPTPTPRTTSTATPARPTPTPRLTSTPTPPPPTATPTARPKVTPTTRPTATSTPVPTRRWVEEGNDTQPVVRRN